jgi:ATP-dependent Lon protease
VTVAPNVFLPVLPLGEVCLFPESSLGTVVTAPSSLKAIQLAGRTGGRLLAVANRDDPASPRDLQAVGTIAEITGDDRVDEGGRRIELDGVGRARIVSVIGIDMLVAEIEALAEGDSGDDWGAAVEALARYLHAHQELRSFLDQQRRSREPMGWVNLACQHLPITASARQRLLESSAAERCRRISRGLDALLRKEQGA